VNAQATPFTLAPRLAELPETELSLDTLERSAVEKSLDLSIARHRFEAAAKRANYSRVRGFLPEVGVGVEAERREEWGVGPAAAVSVPLFYQGQGEVAEAVAEMRKQRETYADIAMQVRAEARAAAARLATTRASVAYYRDVLVPLRSQIVDGAMLDYNAMSIGVFQLLQAKREQIATARQYVEGLRDYWLVRAEVDALLAGRLMRDAVTMRSPPTSSGSSAFGH
jgi:cobalt-zinc-cadmium efflux system outer membrane protein